MRPTIKPGCFPTWRSALPFITLGLAFWLILGYAAFAQTGTGTAQSLSASQSASVAGGGNVNIKTTGATELATTGIVSPPGFSSGHPCAYAPISLGAGIVGYGASAGGQRVDDACLLGQMGYKTSAVAMIAARNPEACKALRAAGRISSASLCDSKEKSRASAKAPTSSAKAATGSGYSKCSLVDGQIRIKYTAGGKKNKAAAQANCKLALGY